MIDGEEPHDGVGLCDEGARRLLVLGVQRVETRRVDDVHALKELERVEHFDEAQARSGPIYFGLFMAFVVVLTVALYRSFRTLIAILVTMGVCLAVSMGFIGLLGGTFTLVSPMVPMTRYEKADISARRSGPMLTNA